MRATAAVLCAVVLVTHVAVAAPVKPKVTVFVTIEIGTAGFVDGGVSDSVRDLQGQIKRRRSLSLATSEASADIVLKVTGRSRESGQAAGSVIVPVGTIAIATAYGADRPTVATMMHFGDFTKAFIAPSPDDTWGQAAAQITRDLNAWVEENSTLVRERRTRTTK